MPLPKESSRPASKVEGAVRVKPGRDRKLRGAYPWVQREEVRSVSEGVTEGALVRVEDSKGEFVGIGTYCRRSRFPVRVLTLEDEPVDEGFFRRRFEQAIECRARLNERTDAIRLAFSESDGLPGLIVDRYSEWLAVQVRTLGMERLRPMWLPALLKAAKPRGIYERSDMEGRREEGLEPHSGPMEGEVPDLVEIREGPLRFSVDVKNGLKTGFYLDQRDNRQSLAEAVAPDESVLDLFCYTGGFSIAAAKSGAQCIGVDIREDAVDLAKQNAERNGVSCEFRKANAFEFLEDLAQESRRFDRVIVDPPAIAKSREKRDSLQWAIWKLVYLALPVLRPGGRILVCSCAYQMSFQDLQEKVRLAANDRQRRLTVEAVSIQPEDHPYLLQFPESLYLKCLWLRSD